MKEIFCKIKKILLNSLVLAIGVAGIGTLGSLLVSKNNNLKSSPFVTIDDNYDRVFEGIKMANPNTYGNPGTDYTDSLSYRVNTTSHTACVSIGTAVFDSTHTSLIIPSIYNDGTAGFTDCDVTAVDYSGFANQQYLFTVTFINSSKITLIDAQAFASCPNMTTFNSTTSGSCIIPANLTKIYSASFMNCASFTKVFFSGGLVTEIGDNAFNGGIGIIKPISFNIASDLTLTIGNSSFANCTSMRTILLPPGVKSIGEKAFYNCSSALMLTIPSSVAYDAATNPTPIGVDAFRLDANIKLAYIGASSRYPQGWPSDGTDTDSQDVIGDTHVTVTDWNYATNYYAIPIKTDTSNIMQYPDENNENLLYTYSFSWDDTHKIYLINILTTSIPTDLTSLVVPQTLPVTGDGVHTSTLMADDLQIGVITTLSTNAIDIPSTALTSISLPNTMSNVMAQAISQSLGTNVLSSLTLNDKGVSDSFRLYGDATNTAYDMDTYGLTGLKTIGNNFLSYTNTSTGTQDFGITSLTIPSTVSTIGKGAFKNCQKITSLVFNGAEDGTSSLTSIGDTAFTYLGAAATSTTFDLVLPGGMTSIGTSAFYKADNIKSVTILDRPSSSTDTYTIGNTAFNNCSKLHYAVLGTGLKQINKDAFSNETSFNWVYMSSTLTTIANPIYQNDRRVVTYFSSSSLPSGVATGWNTNNSSAKDTKFELNDRNTETLLFKGEYFPYYLSVTNNVFGTDSTTDNTLITNNTQGIQYIRRSASNYIISGYLDYSGVTTINMAANGLPTFTSIGDMAFYASYAKNITVVNSITSIGDYAFFFSKSLTHFGSAATNNTFPTSLLTIGNYCFVGTLIGTYGIVLPSSITSIGTLAFWCMNNLPSLSVPLSETGTSHYYADGVTGALYQVTGSTTTGGVTSYSYKLLSFTGTYTGVVNNTTTAYQILDGTTEICSFAFSSAKVASVNIPASVTTLDDHAFYVCFENNGKPNSFYDLSVGPQTLKSITFSENSNLVHIGIACFSWQIQLTTLSFENLISTNTVEILTRAFRRCSGLTSITLPSGNISNGTNADYLAESLFDTCTSLTTIKLPQTIISYGAKCFWNNSSLTSTTECPLFFASLVNFDYGVFEGCASLTAVSFPSGSNLTTIGEWTKNSGDYNVFSKCTGLTSVDFSNCPNLTSLPMGAFYNCTSLASINLTNCTALASLGTYCFSGCSNLETVDFTPCTSLHAFPNYCFNGCSKLKTSVGNEARLGANVFSIPSNITSIGQFCFQNCTSMATLYMPTTITQVGTYVAKGTSTSTLTVYVAYDFTTFNSTMVGSSKWISTWWNLTASTFVKTYFYSSSTPTAAQKSLVPGTVSGGYWYWSSTGSTGVITKYTW